MTLVRISGAVWEVIGIRFRGPGLSGVDPEIQGCWIEDADAWREFAGDLDPDEWADQNPDFWHDEWRSAVALADGPDDDDRDRRRCGWD